MAEYVINRTGEALCGGDFGAAKNKLELIARVLGERRVVMVWDNFESAEGNLTDEDRAELGRFLDAIRGTRGKVIMTSRSAEEWLGPARRFEIRLGGLGGEERWEYCEAVLGELGLKVDRDDAGLKELMDLLRGHPLAMRVVLPKLERMSAAEVAAALRSNIAELGLNEEEEQGRLFGTLRFVERGLAEDLRPLMDLVGLHEGYVDGDYLEGMAGQVDAEWTRTRIDRLMVALGNAGLVREVGGGVFEMHPLLTSYLRSRAASEVCQRAFVDVMGSVANQLAPREMHEQRVPFLLHGANFHFALQLSQRLAMDQGFVALTQSLANYAQNSRDFAAGSRLFAQLAQYAAGHAISDLEAVACHQLGTIAEQHQDFDAAREWYLKALAISEKQGHPRRASPYQQLGSIAEEQRGFDTAREWYLKALAISLEQGDLHSVAVTYHQLGVIAQEQRDVDTAREWYLKSLAINEKQGDLRGAAGSYHQLGFVAKEQGDFGAAREWYLKSLAISERQRDLLYAACTYHHLGSIALAQQDFEAAQEWYVRSLAVNEQEGDLLAASMTYHQLGMIAEKRRDFGTAREWYLKSLAIKEKRGNLHGAALTYGQLGVIARKQGNFEESGQWLTRSITAFQRTHDQHLLERAIGNFLVTYRQAPPDVQQKLEAIWRDAGLGAFPPPGVQL
jgi:tetratricopeptide (TPR) repeat protein